MNIDHSLSVSSQETEMYWLRIILQLPIQSGREKMTIQEMKMYFL